MAKNAEELAVPAEADLPLRVSENIQGNILEPFNKPCQRFLFFSFMNRPQQARDWLGQLVRDGVASTSDVVTHNNAYAQAKKDSSTLPTHEWVGVSFTSSGLVTLDPGLARDLVVYEALWQGALVDRVYRGQRTMSPAVVGDVRRGDPTGWGVGGPGQYPVDAVVTVAADDNDVVARPRQRNAGFTAARAAVAATLEELTAEMAGGRELAELSHELQGR
jgi:hypothetical protein